MSISRPGLEEIDGSGASDGQVPMWDADAGVWAPANTGISTVVAGPGIAIDTTDPANPIVSSTSTPIEPLTTEIGGVPDLVWDDDNQLVMTEAI